MADLLLKIKYMVRPWLPTRIHCYWVTNFLTICCLMGLLYCYQVRAEKLPKVSGAKSMTTAQNTRLSPEQKSMCEVLLTRSLSINFQPTYVDYAARDSWLAAHRNIPPSSRQFLKWLTDRINILSTQDVLESVETVFQKLLSKAPSRKFVFAVADHINKTENKSGAWLTGYIKSRFPEFRSSPVFVVNSNPDPMIVEYIIANPDTQIIALDDVAYSGTQLSMLTENIIELAKVPRERVHIVVGYASARATHSFANKSIDLILSGEVKSVEDLISVEPEPLRTALQRELEFLEVNLRENLGAMPLTLLGYKVPDDFSFPSFLTAGYALEMVPGHQKFSVRREDSGTAIIIKFIHYSSPPYKSVPYLDPQMGP